MAACPYKIPGSSSCRSDIGAKYPLAVLPSGFAVARLIRNPVEYSRHLKLKKYHSLSPWKPYAYLIELVSNVQQHQRFIYDLSSKNALMSMDSELFRDTFGRSHDANLLRSTTAMASSLGEAPS
ncbi:hypothetical protein CRG98_031264 [Punica granatum]|uniref:Uncharacterized protein n=1 Tax=Punica granatum TaxID=22663 RepID=A0A2I0IY09_PUNGR|nr:hypothetical protein CRG98_031264 [Punica granatum]